ncbi:MAG: nicotinate phosphoribosyltransferase [Myxococcales bacterium]|nr:nicotinate phosphoribosyltransferase [Myxococcales bacterium]
MNTVSTLSTDLYQLTMAAGYFHNRMHNKRISMELFVRRIPHKRRFLVVAGLQRALEYLRSIRFDSAHIEYLRRVPSLRGALDFEFVEFLRDFRFRGDVWAMPEGTVAFAMEPLLRVTGTLLEAQLVETTLLSIINTETMIASKAARVVLAAEDTQVLEFGSRRTSPGEAITSARAAFIAGFAATSNVEAGFQHDIPLAGTAAHSWIMAHESEQQAFQNFATVFPDHAIMLVDTYDTLEGTRRAIEAVGTKLQAVRLDSGNLLDLSIKVRKLLDEHDLAHTQIIASGDLNEHKIAELRSQGAPIDAWGVGTELVRSKDAPSLGGVYKLVEDHDTGRSVAKFSRDKATLPGCHQVFRIKKKHAFVRDIVGTTPEFHIDATPLLEEWMMSGKVTRELPSLANIRRRARNQIRALPQEVKLLAPLQSEEAPPYEVRISDALQALIERVRTREVGQEGV